MAVTGLASTSALAIRITKIGTAWIWPNFLLADNPEVEQCRDAFEPVLRPRDGKLAWQIDSMDAQMQKYPDVLAASVPAEPFKPRKVSQISSARLRSTGFLSLSAR